MRSERTIYVHETNRVPLVVRARVERTFFGLGLFAAINLFLCGAYLLMDAIRNPLVASETAIVAAGFMLSLASFLFTYLVWPRAKSALGRDPDFARPERSVRGAVLAAFGEALHTPIEAKRTLTESKNLPGPM